MTRPLKLYNHTHAPNPRRVRIFAAEKGIGLSLEEVDILAGQSRTPEFLAKNSSGAVPVSNSMTVHAFPNRWQFAGIWKGFNLNPIFWGATYANRRRLRGGIAGWNWNCLPQSHARFKIPIRSFKSVLSSFKNMASLSERSFISVSNEWITN